MSVIEFVRASDVRLDEPSSLILEAHVEGKEIAEVVCEGGKWQVKMGDIEGNPVILSWQEFVELTARFSSWIASESEVMFKELLDNAEGNNG